MFGSSQQCFGVFFICIVTYENVIRNRINKEPKVCQNSRINIYLIKFIKTYWNKNLDTKIKSKYDSIWFNKT
jgi:hypothetical protein